MGAGGEQMAFYLGADLGDLLVVTLNKSVILCAILSLKLNAPQYRRGYLGHHSFEKMRA
jgi:hypothetical protein